MSSNLCKGQPVLCTTITDNLECVHSSVSQVFVKYTGRLAHNGKVFESNAVGKGRPFMFRLGQGEVIQGWDEGIAGVFLFFQEGWGQIARCNYIWEPVLCA